MATYTYQGQKYTIDDSVPQEEAIKKIKAHVGKTSQGLPTEQKEILKKQGSSILGGLETGLSMVTGGLAQIPAGLAGLGTSLFEGGAKGGQTVRDIQEALTYKPRTEVGKKYTEKVGDIVNYPIEKAGQGGAAIGGNLGQTLAEAGTELLMNFLPLGAVGKGVKAIGRNKPLKPTFDPTALEAELRAAKAPEIRPEPTQLELDLTTSPQAVAEMQARAAGQVDMFAPINEPLSRNVPEVSPNERPRPLETVAQNELFDQPEQGLVSNPYAANMGEWRVDENGMPIRADLSMELQNLQDPLQRNLWGDELQPRVDPIGQSADLFESQRQFQEQGVQGGIPLTQAMDSMDPAAMRAAVEQTQMGRELPASGELEAAVMQAEGMRVPRGQRGAIDWETLTSLFPKFKGSKVSIPVYHGTTKEINGEFKTIKGFKDYRNSEGGVDKNGWIIPPDRAYPGDLGAWFSSTPKGTDTFAGTRTGVSGGNVIQSYLNLQNPKEFATHNDFIDWFQEKAADGRSANAIRRSLIKEGYDGISIKESMTDGGGMRSDYVAFMPDQIKSAISPQGMRVPQSQRGAIDLGNATEATSEKKRIATLAITSPEVTEAKNQISLDNRKAIAAKITGAEGYRNNIDTPEKVIASAAMSKDLSKAQLIRGETVTPGINALAIDSNNPLIKFVREKTRRVFQESEALAREYITDKETGIGPLLNKMSQAEKNDMVAVLQLGDKTQTYVTRANLEGKVSENVIRAVEKFYEMDRKKLEIWNEARAKVGMEPVRERPGHFPGVFKGDYKQIVMNEGKVVGVIAVDSKWQLKTARETLLKQYPNAQFTNVDRRALGGNGRKSDMFSGMNDVLTMLAKNDPEFAKVQELISKAVRENADALYGAAFHSMEKKGIVGNEGNKPWLSQKENTNAAIKSYLEYWEEGITAHKNLPVEAEIKGLMDNPALDNMPNAKQYVNSYIKNMTGRDIGSVGDALNKLLDAPFKAAGVGPTVPREIVNQLNKRLGQQTMGFFNWMFSAIQFLQMPQMAFPEMIKVAKELNLDSANITKSLASTLLDLMKEYRSGDGSPLFKAAQIEARRRGLDVFSEYQDVNKVTQNKYSRAFDEIVDYNRSKPEQLTRPWVFYTFVNMMKDSGLPKQETFDIAYNATQRSMVDYSPRERPMMYQRLGVAGQLAGSLQTFKHAQLSQLTGFATSGNIAAFGAAAMTLLAFAGVKGVPFYQEADELFKYISDKFFGERKTIADSVLGNLPEWMKSGALSTATDINMQGRLSAANVIPDTPLEALTPFSSAIARQGEAAWNLMTKQDPLAFNEFVKSVAPSGPIKGIVETTLNTNEKGMPVDKRGELGNPRSEWDVAVKRSGAGTSLTEALRNETQFNQMMRERSNKEAQRKIIEKAQRAAAQGLLTPETQKELIDNYIARKGDPQQFINSMVEYQKILQLNKQQRLQGIPNGSLPSIYRYQNYQEK